MSLHLFFQKFGILRSCQAGRQLFLKGDPADTIYYLVKGRVRAFFLYPDGTDRTVCFVDQGNLVGEEVFADPPIRSFCVDASTDLTLLAISRTQLMEILRQDPDVGLKLLGLCMRKIELLCSWIFYAQFRENRAKLACFLYTESEHSDSVCFTQQEIADVTGMSRMSVSTCLRGLKEAGLAEAGYRTIRVLDRDGLRQLFGEFEYL